MTRSDGQGPDVDQNDVDQNDVDKNDVDQHPVGAVLVACLEAMETDGPAGVDRVLADHPEHAAAARVRLRLLAGFGVIPPAEGAERTPPRQTIGEFRLIERIGAGGMGVVWLAEQTSLGRRVAVKLLRPGLADSPIARDRLAREARAIAKLDHPSIVSVIATGEDDGLAWLAMEHVAGRELEEFLREATADGRAAEAIRVVGWARDVARALAAAHDAGVTHRDVKPSNIRITGDGRAVLLDFGLARSQGDKTLTRTAAFQGSPYYAAPEQVRGESVGSSADVYSLGVTLYECLAGRAPFEGRTTEQVFHGILFREPRPLRRSRPDVSKDLETVILKAMEKRPEQRYSSMHAFAADLDAVLALRPILARRPGVIERGVRLLHRNRPAVFASLAAALVVVAAAIAVAL